MELPGLWFDGRASRGWPVRVRMSDQTLEMQRHDGHTETWPLDAVGISPRLGRTPRVLRLPAGGRIEVADSPAFDCWLGQPVSRLERAADWLERHRLAIAFSAIATVCGAIVFVVFGVPWLAERIAPRIPVAIERQASDEVVALLRHSQVSPSRLPIARQQAIVAAFAQLVAGEPRAVDMRLQLVNAPSVGANAFTLPDGRIFLTDQLVKLTRSDDEVMAVLAHEAGHHVHRHAMRLALENSSVFLAAGLTMGDVSGSSLAVSLPVLLLSNGFSRGHEREADDYAFALLKRRGKSPRAFADILRRLLEQVPAESESGPIGYLSTHPPTPGRIRAAEAAASN